MGKITLKLFIGSFLGGLVGALFLSVINFGFLGANVTKTINQQNKTIENPQLLIPSSELWEKNIVELSPSLVGVQTINDNQVIRQGSGIIISSDGLVVTTADLWGPKGSIYQIFYDDKIAKGELIKIDSKTKLLLIKTTVSNSNIVELSTSDYRSGQEVLVVGKVFSLSKPVIASQKGIISQVSENSVIIDIFPNKYLHGFGVSDKDGQLRGIVYLKNGMVNLIKSEVIEKFFKDYLEKNSQ